jgi:hypothetical protein
MPQYFHDFHRDNFTFTFRIIPWIVLPSGTGHVVVWHIYSDIPQKPASCTITHLSLWSKQVHMKRCHISGRLHGVTSQETVIFIGGLVQDWCMPLRGAPPLEGPGGRKGWLCFRFHIKNFLCMNCYCYLRCQFRTVLGKAHKIYF